MTAPELTVPWLRGQLATVTRGGESWALVCALHADRGPVVRMPGCWSATPDELRRLGFQVKPPGIPR